MLKPDSVGKAVLFAELRVVDASGEPLSAGASSSADEVREFCRQSLAGFKVPRRVAFQHEPLPRTPTGKVQKFLLAESYRHMAIREK